MLLGSHLSIGGGLDNALLSAGRHGFSTLAMFLRNQCQWRARPLEDDRALAFRKLRRELGISAIVAHGSYLVNLAGQKGIRQKSIAAMVDDLDRCGRLGIEYLVIHPGANIQKGRGIRLISWALNTIVARCPSMKPKILLETTAGQGNSLGCSFEQLALIISQVESPRRIGVCLDTCHVFAAGYDMRSPKGYRSVMRQFDDVLSLDNLLAVHLNDSKRDFGSRVDRHEHIGQGKIGAGLANIVNDRRLSGVPMILETPKGKNAAGEDWDEINAAAIGRMIKPRRPGRPRARGYLSNTNSTE